MKNVESRPDVAGIRISHPERLIFPALGISKLDLAHYAEVVGDWMLPHVAGRPLTLVHCPDGLSAPCLFLKHAKAWGPNALRRIKIQEKTKVGEYLIAESIPAIVALIQMGIVEIHTWNVRSDDLERPNRLVWDLDPGVDADWTEVVTAARLVRKLVKTLGLETWVKTTGGRGAHVVAPLNPSCDWSQCLAFAHGVAMVLVRMNPAMYTTTFAKAGRERKILIDYLRNNRTNTSICAFSVRAREGAPVSMPLKWSELNTPPSAWTLRTVPQRLARMRSDPWADYWRSTQRLTKASLKALTTL